MGDTGTAPVVKNPWSDHAQSIQAVMFESTLSSTTAVPLTPDLASSHQPSPFAHLFSSHGLFMCGPYPFHSRLHHASQLPSSSDSSGHMLLWPMLSSIDSKELMSDLRGPSIVTTWSVVIQQDVVHLRVLLAGCHIFVIYRPNLKALTPYCFFIKLALPAFAGILLDLDIYSPILRRSSYSHVTLCYKDDWGRPYKPSFTGTSTQMPRLHTITTVFFNDLRKCGVYYGLSILFTKQKHSVTRDGPGYLSYVPLRDGYLRRWKRRIRSEITTLCALSAELKLFRWNKGELRRHNLNPALALYQHGEETSLRMRGMLPILRDQIDLKEENETVWTSVPGKELCINPAL
ncbi:hypothetical protein M752DRAFT_285347 [Aspergillus phoenicis ATCC 13157]|uniref:Uncharacterized protein n=1 Tax=Aspergillus phoenicis ATCC 13157 TaxID=1353007 RepID=A0A370PCN1_ASPPH|nr:hypothetical protein M752DRAFT_285347 [Aspergillus phoenicis ATCC 13157]